MTTPIVIVKKVLGRTGDHIGFEFEIGGETYFYANNQWLWEGLRLGEFPCGGDGERFERAVAYDSAKEVPA